ncbi:glycosyltransferase [Clostridiales bacterium COT073_COT-073]|nr:glycosyltransferase [Clostridiales bacterium COT073_COT-073]
MQKQKSRKIIEILGVTIDVLTMDKAVATVKSWLSQEQKRMIFTVNPEIIMLAKEDPAFAQVLNSADMVTADGIGVVIASKKIGRPLPERVAGYDLQLRLFAETEAGYYFLGAAEGVAAEAARKIMAKYPKAKVVGCHNGYFNRFEDLIEEINACNPDVLLVGLGAKKQEELIARYQDQLNAKIFIGVGGSFDGFSGKVKRAPDIFIRLHLEWFYRLLKQPSRWKRMLKLPLFLVAVRKSKKS